MHPKRILCLHMENISSTPADFHLHIAGLDSVPFEDLVMASTKGLTASNAIPEPVQVDDDTSDWNIIYPVSQFLTTYKIPLPPTEATYSSPFADTFTLRATRDVLNSIKRTRSLDIELKHPGLIWPVVAFNGDVISWGASSSSPRPCSNPRAIRSDSSTASQIFPNLPSAATSATTSNQSEVTASTASPFRSHSSSLLPPSKRRSENPSAPRSSVRTFRSRISSSPS